VSALGGRIIRMARSPQCGKVLTDARGAARSSVPETLSTAPQAGAAERGSRSRPSSESAPISPRRFGLRLLCYEVCVQHTSGTLESTRCGCVGYHK
jgi:hypothetical protein